MKPRLPTLKPRVPALKPRLKTIVPGSWRSGKTTDQRGYTYQWKKRREAQLREHPLCAICRRNGYVQPATVADHITPHRGDPELFAGPLQSLCASCHSAEKQREEQQRG